MLLLPPLSFETREPGK